jgi:hypothetical protein
MVGRRIIEGQQGKSDEVNGSIDDDDDDDDTIIDDHNPPWNSPSSK